MQPYAATAAEATPSFAPQWVAPGVQLVALQSEPADIDPEDVTAIWVAPSASNPAPAPAAAPVASRVVENMPPYVAANGAMPDFHWASPPLWGAADPLPGLEPADISQLMVIGELREDLQEEKEHLLTSGTPAWMLPAVTLFCVLATLVASFAGDAVAIARLALDAGLALIVG